MGYHHTHTNYITVKSLFCYRSLGNLKLTKYTSLQRPLNFSNIISVQCLVFSGYLFITYYKEKVFKSLHKKLQSKKKKNGECKKIGIDIQMPVVGQIHPSVNDLVPHINLTKHVTQIHTSQYIKKKNHVMIFRIACKRLNALKLNPQISRVCCI